MLLSVLLVLILTMAPAKHGGVMSAVHGDARQWRKINDADGVCMKRNRIHRCLRDMATLGGGRGWKWMREGRREGLTRCGFRAGCDEKRMCTQSEIFDDTGV